MVNRGGITFAFRAAEETGATPEQVARAFVVCREVFDLTSYVAAVEALDNVVSTGAQTALYLEFRRLLDRVGPVVPAEPPVVPGRRRRGRAVPCGGRRARPADAVPAAGGGAPAARAADRRAGGGGRAEPIATRAAGLLDQYSLLDVVEICAETGRDAGEVAPVYFATSEQFGIDAMLSRVTRLPRDDRWDALARGALRDDLYAVLESLTTSVLEASDPGQTATERIAQWAKTNAESLTRARTALSGIERIENPGIAALSVALRTLRGVIRSGAATT